MITPSDIAQKMRISHDGLNDEIQDNIDACILDFKRVGVDINTAGADKLIDKAIELYCKAENDYQGKGEEFRRNYEKLRDAISLCEDYRRGDA